MTTADIGKERPQRIHPKRVAPWFLRRLAIHAGIEPSVYLADLLGRHETYREAANEVGVTELTLRNWRRRLQCDPPTAGNLE